ncbi:Lcl domain-containing protein [Sediminicola sp. 1XM1-17]|uniref:Lcl domain-containing protein n=1 Tax=Sediminicola sp. 1XM1-17 TaxID=3127702 RepID=UPI003076CD58
MKNILTVIIILISVNALAQTPEKISYQAVIRNENQELLVNQNIGFKISILKDNINGLPVYIETQSSSTNGNGLVTLEIGNGVVLEGLFKDIEWGIGSYFIKMETDPNGGSDYSINGISEIMSTPYALHAKTADFAKNISNKHYIGELFGGGIVFALFNNGENGLIASLHDLDNGNGASWGTNTVDVENCESMTNGMTNTQNASTAGQMQDAANLCLSYSAGNFTDWYLPSNRELYLLAAQDVIIDKVLDNDNDNSTHGLLQENIAPTYSRYWSSTELDMKSAWYYHFYAGVCYPNTKSTQCKVRAIRAF